MFRLRGKTTDKLVASAGSQMKFSAIRNMSLASKISLVVLLIIVLTTIFADVLAPYDPLKIFLARRPPSLDFLFGTDDKGRDVLSRMLYGGRYSLVIGLGATAFALVIGSIIGSLAAAAARKWIDESIMRIMDIFMSFPGIALAAIFVLTFGNSLPSIVFAIGILYVPQITRIVRANILSEYHQDYARAAKVSGAKSSWIIAKHVVRNCAAPILVFTIVLIADAIVFEASLSFISAGIPEPTPTWGNILSDARDGVLSGRWWQACFPGIAIMLTVLAFNILAEGMTDMLASPKSKPLPKTADESKQVVKINKTQYAKDMKALDKSLAELKKVELKRKDRLSANFKAKEVLKVEDLCIQFPRHGKVNVVENINFVVREGQTMGLVGESGCGKSITSFSIMGLLDPKAKVTGKIMYGKKNLLDSKPDEMQELRGKEIAMIYQDALSSLNPSMLIRSQMKQLTSRGGTRSAEDLLKLVGLDPERVLDSYPHELSGGQRQRVLIAMALTRDPKLIIADEPTTALDVTVQKQVIKLLRDLQKKLGFAMIFVSHDLALVAEVANYITVMYAGQVVETGTVKEIMTNPIHEYTRGLLGSVVSIEGGAGRLHQIVGAVPSPQDFPKGDRFAPRSSHPEVKSNVLPVLKQYKKEHHFYSELPDDELKKLKLTPYAKRKKSA